MTIQGHTLHVPVYLLANTGENLVLGAPWLKTLGPHIADYESFSIKFYMGNTFITLHGDTGATLAQAQFHHIDRMQRTRSIDASFILQFQQLQQQIGDPGCIPVHLPPDLTALLYAYLDVFAEPLGLPPPRVHDHAIPLLEGSNPVKVKPYRYPHSQKTHIEKMVHEMLSQGIIQPSTSPFASPVLLVKKKDGTWHFCTDYRALNAITVKDSFPIPTIDELLMRLFSLSWI